MANRLLLQTVTFVFCSRHRNSRTANTYYSIVEAMIRLSISTSGVLLSLCHHNRHGCTTARFTAVDIDGPGDEGECGCMFTYIEDSPKRYSQFPNKYVLF